MVSQLRQGITKLRIIADLNKLSSLTDPLHLYRALSGNVDLSDVTISKPEIRDHDGSLIHPREYSSKLKDGTVVGLQVCLKLLRIFSC
jgi:hypothetical protein